MSAHVKDNAAGLVALAAADPDRVAAFAHAQACAACAAALAEAEQTLFLLDTFAQPTPPSADALARVRAELARAITHEPAPRRVWALVPMLAALAAGLVPLAGHFTLGLSGRLAGALAGGFAASALLGVTLVGPPAAFALLPAMSAVMAAAWGGGGPVHAPGGFQCLGFALAGSVPALACAAWLVRQGKLTRPTVSLAAAAAAGALGSQAALSIVCETAPSHAHNFAFHSTAVVLAGLVGYMLAKTPWLQVRSGRG